MAETKKTKEETVVADDPGMELVDAFYQEIPDTKYSGDITVGLNGVMYKVKRGVNVKIPRAIKEIIDNSYAEDQKVAERIRSAQRGQTVSM